VLLLISDSSSWRFAGPAAYKQFQAICLKVGTEVGGAMDGCQSIWGHASK